MTRPFPWETPGIDYCPGPVLVVAGDRGSAVSVGPDPGRRPKPDERTRSHTRPTRTPASENPWPDKLNEWIAEGQPDPWEVRLVDMPREYKARVQAQNRLRLGWRHQMRRLGLPPEEYSTRFVQTEAGVWWFRWWVR